MIKVHPTCQAKQFEHHKLSCVMIKMEIDHNDFIADMFSGDVKDFYATMRRPILFPVRDRH